jgi:hypothetical protein
MAASFQFPYGAGSLLTGVESGASTGGLAVGTMLSTPPSRSKVAGELGF